jgi:hypothetical protein
LEVNSNDAPNRRILARGDPPQNLEDAAALKLRCVFEYIPHLNIVRLTVCTDGPESTQHHRASTRARPGIMVLELRSSNHPLGSRCGLYLRVELALTDVLAKSVEELVAQVCDEFSAAEGLISTLALKGGLPPLEELLAN